MRATPLVLHIPHSSLTIPEEERSDITLSDGDLARELLVMTDAWTDELFPVTAAEVARIVCPVSRLVCDVERFPNDGEEPMAAKGMGAVYARTHDGAVLRAPPKLAERERILARWYRPHHAALSEVVRQTVERFGSVLVVDCHSFGSRPLPHEPDQHPTRPEICIGTDVFHTPAQIRHAALAAALDFGWTVDIDKPFAGSLVPSSAYRSDPRVLSLMIEVRRDLYMDEATGAKALGFGWVQEGLGRLLEAIALAAIDRDRSEHGDHGGL